MKIIKNILFFSFLIIFIVAQIFLIKTLKNLYSVNKFFLITEKIEKIVTLAFSTDEIFLNLTRNSNCAIFKIPSINDKNFILKDFFDYTTVLYHNEIIFFNLQPSPLSARNNKSYYIKNIKNFKFRYLGNVIEFSCLINGIPFSCDLAIEKNFVKIPFYNRKVF